MCKPKYQPLNYPKVWPPPNMSPASPECFEYKIKYIPIAGWIVAFILAQFRWSRFRREVLSPIEDEIVEQLDARETMNNWYQTQQWLDTPQKQKIALIISEVIGLEKPIESPPPLHPEDPFGPLFWGPFDDLTPIFVRFEIEKHFGCRIPSNDLVFRAWDEQWTIAKFIDYYDELISRDALGK
ncbi:hypothetical protein [uncultured Gimesia sp.]|uniref:hypothetical protein n=1 Tax=uncultured Gimesia sp. TaxID=1678688 RepID=UPI00260E321F|nr:hypothetical protein [uncultured Gimesia sp.]